MGRLGPPDLNQQELCRDGQANPDADGRELVHFRVCYFLPLGRVAVAILRPGKPEENIR